MELKLNTFKSAERSLALFTLPGIAHGTTPVYRETYILSTCITP